jgi:hypothetical protein
MSDEFSPSPAFAWLWHGRPVPSTPGGGDITVGLAEPNSGSAKAEAGDGNTFMSNDGLIWVDLELAHKNKQSFFSWKRLGLP